MGQQVNSVQKKENTARYYAFQGANMGTTSGADVAFTPVVSITTKGGALEMEFFCTCYVSSNTGFFSLLVNGVYYEVITVSGTSERGFYGKAKTPALPAGTYNVQLTGRVNGGASINIPAYCSQTIFVKEVAAG